MTVAFRRAVAREIEVAQKDGQSAFSAALAAIAEMREPSAAMMAAAREIGAIPAEQILQIWQAMIDRALR